MFIVFDIECFIQKYFVPTFYVNFLKRKSKSQFKVFS